MQRVRELCGDEPLLQLLPYKIKKAAVLATGSEVFHGRIKDTFTPVLEKKLAEFNVEVVYKQVLDDKPEQITAAIKTAIEEKGAEMVLCTGGMSVDPDDRTPLAIKTPVHALCLTVRRCFRGQCFCCRITAKTRCLFWACRDA